MADVKTKPTSQDPRDFIKTIEPETKRRDSLTLLDLFEKSTGQKGVMWGVAIVGFGLYHYKSERSSQEGDWPLVGFSPRKQSLTLYVLTDREDRDELYEKLGKYKINGSCLHIKKLSDVDITILSSIIKNAYLKAKQLYLTK